MIMLFIQVMKPGDLIVVPYGPEFYVAEITGPCTYDPSLIEEDTADRRACRWLNDKKPIPRIAALSGLQWRLKARQTCVEAADLVDDIKRVIEDAATGAKHDFLTDLRGATLERLRSPSAQMNDWEFEHLVKNIFLRLGASQATITPRKIDKGDDIVANFERLGLIIAAQVKYHPKAEWKTGESNLDRLLAGMDARDADIGWLVTCGKFEFDVAERGRQLAEQGKRVWFVDGAQLAALLVDVGAGLAPSNVRWSPSMPMPFARSRLTPSAKANPCPRRPCARAMISTCSPKPEISVTRRAWCAG